ncbi:MAG: oligosaccharide flippase family protein [Candidatus Saccharibacteria bacterium]
MSNKIELLKNTFILATGKLSAQLISFLLLPIYTAFLSPSEYGVLDLTIIYMALLVPIITIQLEMASFRFLIENRKNKVHQQQIISNVIQTVTLILVIFIVIYAIFYNYINIRYANLILLNVCLTAYSNLFLQFARGFGDNKRFSIASVIIGFTTLTTTIGLAIYGNLDVQGILLSLAFANFLCIIYLIFSLKLYKYINISSSNKDTKQKLLKYSYPLVPSAISWWIVSVSDRTIISIFLGIAANGIYAIANKYATIFNAIFAIFNMSWIESASIHIDDHNRDNFFSETANANIKVFGSLGLLLIAYIPLVFTDLVNRQYNEAYLYIPILTVAAFFNALAGFYSAIYIAKKLSKQVANISIVAAIINIIINLIFIQYIGIYAAALSTVIAYLAVSIHRHYDIKKYVSITYEKGIFINMAILYAFAIILYYYNNVIGNVLNAVIITIIAIVLNKSVIKVIKDKVLSVSNRKRSKLIIEQDLYENSI